MYRTHIFLFSIARLSAALLGSILGTHLDTILQARVVIGAIARVQGELVCEALPGDAQDVPTGGVGPFKAGLGSANGCPTAPSAPPPPVQRRNERE